MRLALEKRALCCGLMALSAAAFSVQADSVQTVTTKAPRLTCDQPIFDFGTMDNRSNVEHTFTLRNEGQLPLVIDRVQAGCGCTSTTLSTNTIPPGGTALLSARLTLHGVVGVKRVGIFVHSNDPRNAIFSCQFAGTALEAMSISPAQISTAIAADSTNAVEQPVNIVNRTGVPLHITGVQAADFFTAGVRTNEEGRSYTVKVRIPPGLRPPGEKGILLLTTDHPGFGRIEIPVSVSVISAIIVLPSVVILDGGAGRNARYVMLRSTKEAGFTVTSIETAPTNLPASVQSAKPAWARLVVGPAPAGMTGGAIRVHTDSPLMPEIAIPVSVNSPAP